MENLVSTSLLITTLDEIDGIKKILPEIKKEWVDEIIIVDGGSIDGTVEKAREMGFKVIKQKILGYGGAILAGVEESIGDKIIIFGADGSNETSEIPQLVEKGLEGFDQVTISRFGKTSINEDAGIIDGFGNKMFSFITNILFGGKLTDTLTSSRLFTRKALLEIALDELSLCAVEQITIRGLKRKQRFYEIIGNERARIGGERKMRRVPTGAALVVLIIKEFIFWKI